MAIDTTNPTTRRAILVGAIGATAASVAGAVGRASPVRAADGDPMLVGHTYSATTRTEIDATGSVALWGTSDTSTAVHGKSNSGNGVDARSTSGSGIDARSSLGVAVAGTNSATQRPAILGQSHGLSTGVQGWSGHGPAPAPIALAGIYGSTTLSHGQGVVGESTWGNGVFATSSHGNGVLAIANGDKSVGVSGQAASGRGACYGIYGEANSSRGTGVFGYADTRGGKTQGVCGQIESPVGVGAVVGHSHAPTGSAPGVLGTTSSPDGIAVMGTGAQGRGGVFSGAKAQLRLMPSTAASHPSTGLKGDLFVDTSGRLWFCKGGSSWKQVSLV